MVDDSKPIVPQIGAFAKKEDLTLAPGWKVEFARQAKARLLKAPNFRKAQTDAVDRWVALFEQLDA